MNQSKSPLLATHRKAVMLVFGLNGWLYASWAARVPDIQQQYGIDDAAVGLVLITASLGAFLSMPFAAYINRRFGVSRVCLATALLYIFVVPLIPRFSSPAILFTLYAFMGVSFGLLDVAMNAQAVELEKRYGRSIISSFHAGFSGAMIFGAVVSSLLIYMGLSFSTHLLVAGVLALGLLLYAYPRLLPDDEADLAQEPEADTHAFQLPVRATWLIGAIGFCSMMSEASISDWTTKFMREVAGSTATVAPLSLAAFAVTMTVGRIFGDRIRDRFADAQILRFGGFFALLGMCLTLLFPSAVTTILGAGMIGSGLSIAVPIVFSLSGKLPGLSPSAALSMVTSISYLGLFLGPAVIGFLTEHFGLRIGYGWILLALSVMLVLSFRVKTRTSTS